MSNLKFQNPPERSVRYGVMPETQIIIDQLKANPGRWAIVKEDTYPTVAQQWKKRGFEAKSSTVGKKNGLCDVYVRWSGEQA